MARLASRQSAEANIPTTKENKKVFSSTSTIRQNSPLLMPPQQQGHGQHREDRQQTIERIDRGRHQLAQHDVVSLQGR